MKTKSLFFLIGFFLIGFIVQSQNNPPVALNDTIRTTPGYSGSINVLLNDSDPDGDSIFISKCALPYENGYIFLESDYNQYFIGKDTIRYFYAISDDTSNWQNSFSVGHICLILESPYYDYLNINNVNAQFNCFGNHFWGFNDKSAQYFVPNGGTQISIFSNAFWIGGVDENNELHLAAERYRQGPDYEGGVDYWPGPISNTYDSIYDVKWTRIWKLKKMEIDYHKNHWYETGYEPIETIQSWPGNGDTDNGQMDEIAPFYDVNQDGVYNPMEGDFPIIRGDQALFFVFNDVRDSHTDSEGTALGIEVHGMAYAFDAPDDSALWNTTFLNYEIINLSDTTYNETYIGNFTDIDLGYALDDYIGCDVQNGFYYAYNGVPLDGNGQPWAYGENPPVQGVAILAGPYMDDDDIDNPKYDSLGQQICDESVNGLNFGDTIVDNERFGMTNFMYFNNVGVADYMTDPDYAPQYYDYMRSLWKDNTHCMYGGNGHFLNGAYGPECNFMFPGDSDPCNWGTYGNPPNGSLYWTEETANNAPYDRRGLASSGPFSFKPGDVQKVDLAFVWARAYNEDPWSSVSLLKDRCHYIKEKFENDFSFFSSQGINNSTINKYNLFIYPNPATDKFTLKFPAKIEEANISIYSMKGDLVFSQTIFNKIQEQINTSSLLKGLYIIKVLEKNTIYTGKFLKE